MSDKQKHDKDNETDKDTILSQLKEEYNLIQQKKALLKEHDILIKE